MYSLIELMSQEIGVSVIFLSVILIWSLVWKLLAMWKAAEKQSPAWFVILAMINTVGILEILYFYLFSEMKLRHKPKKRRR